MRKIVFFAAIAIFTFALTAFGQTSNIMRVELPQAEIDRIIKQATDNEFEFRQALNNYVFDRSANIGTIGMGGQVTGVYRRDSFMTFTQDGRRFERITYFPVPTITEITVTPEDLEDLGGVNPFALEPRHLSEYKFDFVGTEKIDELDLYVFDVEPKVMPDPKKSKIRLFQGRIWIDKRDLMIVKSKGKGVPEWKQNKFPVVETWRENVDGKYWFPSFSSSDDELVFDNGLVVKMRVRVKYENYKLGRTEVRVIGEEDVPNEPEKKP